MKKIYYILLIGVIVLFDGCGDAFDSNVDFVKKSYMIDDLSISIGDALDKYPNFTKSEWKEFKTPQGKEIVEFQGYYEYNGYGVEESKEVIICIQFTLNENRQKDKNGQCFNVSYKGYSYIKKDGGNIKLSSEFLSSDLLADIMNNKKHLNIWVVD